MVLAGHPKLAAAKQAALELTEKLLRFIPQLGSRPPSRSGVRPEPRPEAAVEDGWEPAETLQREPGPRRHHLPDCDTGCDEMDSGGAAPGRYNGGHYRG